MKLFNFNLSWLKFLMLLAGLNFLIVLFVYDPSEWTLEVALAMSPFILVLLIHVAFFAVWPLVKAVQKLLRK